jgi:hypothetical protein
MSTSVALAARLRSVRLLDRATAKIVLPHSNEVAEPNPNRYRDAVFHGWPLVDRFDTGGNSDRTSLVENFAS